MEVVSGSSESSTVEQNHHNHEDEGCDESSELELGLGLSLSCPTNHLNIKQIPRILTAKDLTTKRSSNCRVVSPPSSASSCSSLGLLTPLTKPANTNSGVTTNNNVSSGTKRAASPTAVSQVVGWPPIRSYRMNSMATQAKSMATGELNSEFEENKGAEDKATGDAKDRLPHKNSLFVKVNMDGLTIGRKVDLNAHSGYESLARTLEEMFANRAAEKSSAEELMLMPKVTRTSKLLDGTADFVLTYEDKDGDWMLVGDVPWGMFLSSVKRLRIMRTSEANGLGRTSAPRSEERNAKQRSRPI